MESVAFIQWCLGHLNYWTITLLMTIESSFIPFPSELVVPPAAWKAATSGELSLPLIIMFATIGSLLGALVNYGLAIWLGRPIVYKFANSRWGHLCLLNQKKVENAERFFDKHGAVSTFVGRLIPAVRQLISIPAGLARMKMTTFVFFTVVGAGLWNAVLAVLGYVLPKVVPGINSQEELLRYVTRYSNEIGYGVFALVLIALAIVAQKNIKKRKHKKQEE